MATSGLWPATIRSSPGAVLGLRHDLDALLAQQRDQALAQERLVLDDHHPHGSSARTVVPLPAGLVTSNVPSSASTRWRRPGQPGAGRARRRRAPRRATSTTSRPSPSDSVDVRGRPAGVLGRVGQRLGRDEVGGGLDHRRRPAARATACTVTSIGERRAERLDRRLEAAVGEHRRRDPAREVAQLADRRARLLAGRRAPARRPPGGRRAAPRRARAACSARRAAPARRRAGRARCAAARRPGRRGRRRGCASARRRAPPAGAPAGAGSEAPRR